MGIKILSVKDFASKLKATIQATGKLGFTEETAKAMSLSIDSYIQIGYEEETDTFYMVLMPGPDPDAFKVCSAGTYFYLPTTSLFRAMGLDYETRSILFDLMREEGLDDELGGKVYKMSKRLGERRKKAMM